MRTSSLRLGLILTLTLTLFAAGGALAVPQTITYQGLLSDDGDLVTGSKSVTFRIYGTSTSGTSLWKRCRASISKTAPSA